VADPTPTGNQYADAVGRLRTTAQWLIGAFGAVGTALIAGIQLKSLGGVHGTALTETIFSIAVGLIGVAAAIWATSNVLIPIAASPGALLGGREFRKVREQVQQDATLLRDLADTLPELVAARTTSLEQSRAAYAAMVAAPNDQALRDAYAVAEDRRKRIGRTIDDLVDLGIFLRLREVFVAARAWMVVGALLAAAGAIGFVHFSNAPPKKAAAGAAPPGPAVTSPAVVTLHLTAEGARLLRQALGQGCPIATVRAAIVGGSAAAPEIVTLPRRGCRARRLTLTPGLGTTIS
jgi:hypothetical protein